MAMFVSVGVAMWVRMHDVTMPVLVGMFVRMLVRMPMLVKVRVSFAVIVIVLFACHVCTCGNHFPELKVMEPLTGGQVIRRPSLGRGGSGCRNFNVLRASGRGASRRLWRGGRRQLSRRSSAMSIAGWNAARNAVASA
jgi:hypothetical protein